MNNIPNSNRLQSRISELFEESLIVKRKTLETCSGVIEAAARLIAEAFKNGGKLMICGNGGSAADAQHIATELVCRLSKELEREALPALALTCDTSFLTAYMNDYGINGIFARQVQGLSKPGDILLGISTSGTSANVVEAIQAAKKLGVKTITLTGGSGILTQIADINIAVKGSADPGRIQESHICIYHTLVDLVECILFNKLKV